MSKPPDLLHRITAADALAHMRELLEESYRTNPPIAHSRPASLASIKDRTAKAIGERTISDNARTVI